MYPTIPMIINIKPFSPNGDERHIGMFVISKNDYGIYQIVDMDKHKTILSAYGTDALSEVSQVGYLKRYYNIAELTKADQQ